MKRTLKYKKRTTLALFCKDYLRDGLSLDEITTTAKKVTGVGNVRVLDGDVELTITTSAYGHYDLVRSVQARLEHLIASKHK